MSLLKPQCIYRDALTKMKSLTIATSDVNMPAYMPQWYYNSPRFSGLKTNMTMYLEGGGSFEKLQVGRFESFPASWLMAKEDKELMLLLGS